MALFFLDTHKNKFGECPIRVSVRAKGERFMSTIGYSISPDLWQAASYKVKTGTSRAPVTNAEGIPAATINARIADISAAFSRIEADPATATIEAFRAQLDGIKGKSTSTKRAAATDKDSQPLCELLTYFDKFVAEQSIVNQWADATLKCFHAFRRHLTNYGKTKFADFDERGLNGFVKYLRYDGGTGEGLEEKSVQKHFNNLKWFLNWAIRYGYCKSRESLKYRANFKLIAKPVIFLTRDELMKLYRYEIPKNGTIVTLVDAYGKSYQKVIEDAGGMGRTRDLFCFCAFTSLRYSDMAALKPVNIHPDKIIVTTQKTHDRLTIPLNKYAKEILTKYEDYQDPRGLALPVIANQRMNHYLKDLCELCGFNDLIVKECYRAGKRVTESIPKWQLVGTHAARRTFISNALTMGIPPRMVMKWTGHNNYEAMKPYIEMAEDDAEKAMRQFDNL